MKNFSISLIILTFIPISFYAHDTRKEFCEGWIAGWKEVHGKNVFAPMCPAHGPVPSGSTPYDEGMKMGFERAKKEKT